MKTQFKGKPLIEIPINIPQADFLRGAFGEEVLKEYKATAKRDYNNNKALNVLSYKDGIVTGSNPFAIALLNQILRQEGLRTVSQADLERILNLGILSLQGTYEGTSLILRSRDEPNSYLAGNLAEQIEKRQQLVYPVMIPLNGLELINDSSSNYGLAFKLMTDNFQVIHAPILNQEGNFSSQNINPKTGLPNRLGEGNRHLYSRNSGLSGLYLGGDLSLSDGDANLDSSGSYGRVVVVSGEATSK